LRNSWKDFSKNEEHPFYEVITKEFIEEFSNFIAGELDRLDDKSQSPVQILEVGAGDGKLAYHLRRLLHEKGLDIEYHAVDPGVDDDEQREKYTIPPIGENVVQMDYHVALKEYSPQIVIESWMPPGRDFSQDFRDTASVQSYVLIGPPYDTGTPQTWGITKEQVQDLQEEQPYLSDARSIRIAASAAHPYLIDREEFVFDGFSISPGPQELEDLQISRAKDYHVGDPTEIHIFRRNENQEYLENHSV